MLFVILMAHLVISVFHHLLIQKKRILFWLYVLGENNFKVSDIKPNGSIVNVQILSTPKKNGGIQPASNDKKPKRNLYFRFRVEDIPENSIFYEENISNDFLQSAFSKTEMIDFRINEVREMNPKAYEEITKDKTFLPFSKIHFFLLVLPRMSKLQEIQIIKIVGS